MSLCDIMVDLLELTGKILDIPPALLGMTLLSWSNSSGDMWANLAIAKIGMGTTALTASYAGPLFNILMGLGISLCLVTINKPVDFALIESPASLIASVWLMISLIVAITIATKTQGRFSPKFGMILLGVYASFTFTLLIYFI